MAPVPEKRKGVASKAHPWRPCPLGEHWVITHRYHVKPSKEHPAGSVATQSGHCRLNRSKRDHLYKGDILEIASRHFSRLKGPPRADDLGFRGRGNKFDDLIRGWTRYWNEVLSPDEPLDPALVKALIASESGFIPTKWNHLRGAAAAYGLMQVRTDSVQFMKDPKELKDHFVDLTRDDMKDPNLNVCAGIRWLFRKKQLVEAQAKKPVSWRDAVANYKGIDPDEKKLMPRFDRYYRRLHE